MYQGLLEIASHWAAILTAVVAVIAYGNYLCERRQKRLKLEQYLKTEKDEGRDRGQRTVLHLVAALSLSEAEVMEAAFRSKFIKPVVVADFNNRAGLLMLEYVSKSN